MKKYTIFINILIKKTYKNCISTKLKKNILSNKTVFGYLIVLVVIL